MGFLMFILGLVCVELILVSLGEIVDTSRYELIHSNQSVNWSQAQGICRQGGMKLPDIHSRRTFYFNEFVKKNSVRHENVWFDGRCSWKNSSTDFKEDLNLRSYWPSYFKRQITDQTGTKNCLALECYFYGATAPYDDCIVIDEDCDEKLYYVCSQLMGLGSYNRMNNTDCPDHFTKLSNPYYFPWEESCYYNRNKYSWDEALNENLCNGTDYTDNYYLQAALSLKIYLPKGRYWMGLGRYSCTNEDGSELPIIRRDNAILSGDCYLYEGKRNNSYRAVDCKTKQTNYIICEKGE